MVLFLTNLIYQRKELILAGTGVMTIVNILYLIILEMVLAIVSLPLYLTIKSETVAAFFSSKNAYGAINFDYRLRRILTLTGVSFVAIVWLVKLGITLFLPSLVGPLPLYSVRNYSPTSTLPATVISEEVGFETAVVDEALVRPALTEVRKAGGGDYIFRGSGQPNSTVVLLLSNDLSTVYLGDVDASGSWEIRHLNSNFALSQGNHSVIVFQYDKVAGTRSAAGQSWYFKVSLSFVDYVLQNLDAILNYAVIAVIIFGVFLTVLTL